MSRTYDDVKYAVMFCEGPNYYLLSNTENGSMDVGAHPSLASALQKLGDDPRRLATFGTHKRAILAALKYLSNNADLWWATHATVAITCYKITNPRLASVSPVTKHG